MESTAVLLVSAPNLAGEQFIQHLNRKCIPFAAIVNSKQEYNRMTQLGVARIVKVNTKEEHTWTVPDFPVGKVILFEKSLTLCCRYIQICRSWTPKPICVVTGSMNPRLIYRGLGAKIVVHTNGKDVGFLANEEM